MSRFGALSFVLLLFVSTMLFSEDLPIQPQQTREELHVLIKEELLLTVDIYKTQVEILTMMVTLQQLNLTQQNAKFSAEIENLRKLRMYEGKASAEDIAVLQLQLDGTRSDLDLVNANLEQLKLKVKLTEDKILMYYKRIIDLAGQYITDVKNQKHPNLPNSILPFMEENYSILKQANLETGMDQVAFENFMVAIDSYIKFVASIGGNTNDLALNQMQMIQLYSSAEYSIAQYKEMREYLTNLQKMLDSEISDKQELQRKLDELRASPIGKTYEDKIYFASGSVILDQEAIRILREFAASTPPNNDYEIMVTGFSDNTPIGAKLKQKYASNWELSLARSSAVVSYMLDKLNFPPEKVIIAGKGEYSQNPDPNAKDLSRKVEFRFVPKSK